MDGWMDGWIGWHHALPASLLLSTTSLSLPWQELPSREREKEREREKQKLLEDVVDEIFDMVKPTPTPTPNLNPT